MLFLLIVLIVLYPCYARIVLFLQFFETGGVLGFAGAALGAGFFDAGMGVRKGMEGMGRMKGYRS